MSIEYQKSKWLHTIKTHKAKQKISELTVALNWKLHHSAGIINHKSLNKEVDNWRHQGSHYLIKTVQLISMKLFTCLQLTQADQGYCLMISYKSISKWMWTPQVKHRNVSIISKSQILKLAGSRHFKNLCWNYWVLQNICRNVLPAIHLLYFNWNQ